MAASVDASEPEEFTDCEPRERDTEADAGDDDEERDDDGHSVELFARAVPDDFRAKRAQNAPVCAVSVTILACRLRGCKPFPWLEG